MFLALVIVSGILVVSFSAEMIQNKWSVLATNQPKENVTLTVIFNNFNKKAGKTLLDNAIDKLRSNHPTLGINVKFIETEYDNARDQMFKALTNGTAVDVLTLDHPWLGEFAQKGLLTDLTNYTKKWGHLSDWYQSTRDGMTYNGSTYGIWAWTDVRGIWYWKDLLNEAGVDPNSLKTWDGYIESAKKLNTVLRPQGIEGVHLVGANHSPDIEFYPYLWMLGGDIIAQKPGHPTKGDYWFPIYNSSKGVRALEFIKAQIDAGIKPQKNHFWGKEFLDRKFAVMLEALQNHVHVNTTEQKKEFENKVGFLPMFPVPEGNHSATMMGGWELSVTNKSKNKDLVWELITIMEDPKIITPFYEKYGLLPTQVSIGDGEYSANLSKTIPYYGQLISMLQLKGVRPNIPEFPQIAEHIRQALDEVLYQSKDPKEALDNAAAKSAKTLGW